MEAIIRLKNIRLALHNKKLDILNKRVELGEMEKELIDLYELLNQTKKEITDATRSESTE